MNAVYGEPKPPEAVRPSTARYDLLYIITRVIVKHFSKIYIFLNIGIPHGCPAYLR